MAAPHPIRGAAAAALACALTVTAAAAHADETSERGGTTGSRGVGDPYFPNYGNGGYDVRHYDIDVRFNPRTERLQGTTTIELVPTQDLTRFNLDLVLDATRVEVDGVPASFHQRWHELVISPATRLDRGEPATVEVTYGGIPSQEPPGGRSWWITTRDGAIALGEPEIAAWWFPSNDHPTDKARFDVSITVPSGKEAISNGKLIGQTAIGGGWTTWNWELRSRAATYLVFLAIGNYDIEQGRAGGRPYLHAFGTNVGRAAKRSIRFTDEATNFLESRWGEYPYTMIGGVVPNGDFAIGFALETQTRPVYDNAFFIGGPNRSVVIHEMAHQWFGDSLAVAAWKHIWLNEGFATYSEWLWAASVGRRSAQEQFLDLYNSIPAADQFWEVRIGDPGPDRLFHGAVYDRGAMTLQALRNRVGTGDFFRIMRTWASDFADENVRTKQFRALAENTSGEQLDGFFHNWLLTDEKPARTAENGF